MKEPRSCHYLIEINTPQLCQKSFFAEKSKPPVHPIHCAEVVPDDEVAKRTEEASAKKAAEKSKRINELTDAKTPKFPQIKYLGRLAGGNQAVLTLVNGQLQTTQAPSDGNIDSNVPAQADDKADESSPDKPAEEFYGTISKILDLLKYEMSPSKQEDPSDDSEDDEL